MTAARRIALAYHEAGHAVMALETQRKILYACIDPAQCEFPESTPEEEKTRNWIEREVFILLAGPAAEAESRGELNYFAARGDFNDAWDVSDSIFDSAGEQQEWLDSILDRAQAFLAKPHRWAKVQAVAAALLSENELDADRLHEIVKTPVRRTA